jgi:radical SAM protein with 4Fe4S-binding SPASM domain
MVTGISSLIPVTRKEIFMDRLVLNNRFPYLNKNYKLLQFPSYGVLVNKIDNSTIFVNKDAVNLLALCDGKTDIFHLTKILIEKAGQKEDMSKALSNVNLFINYAVSQGHLLLSNEATEIEIDKRGSLDYFLPSHVVVELTNYCNLKCKHCYRSKEHAGFIETNSLLKLLESLSNETLLSVELTGGEPTLHPDFTKIVVFAANLFPMVGVLTNGTNLPPDLIKSTYGFKDRIIFSVSLDSYDPSYHDAFRGVYGSWKKTTQNIKSLVESGFTVRVAMSVTPDNIDHMDKTAEWCVNNGVKIFSYSPVLPFGNAKENNYIWSNEDMWKLYKTGKILREKYKDLIPLVDLENFGVSGRKENCGAGWKSVTIGPDFRVRQCVMADPERDSLGIIDPLNPKQFFEEISNITKRLSEVVPPSRDVCRDCKFLTFCTPCPLRARIVMEDKLIDPKECKFLEINKGIPLKIDLNGK